MLHPKSYELLVHIPIQYMETKKEDIKILIIEQESNITKEVNKYAGLNIQTYNYNTIQHIDVQDNINYDIVIIENINNITQNKKLKNILETCIILIFAYKKQESIFNYFWTKTPEITLDSKYKHIIKNENKIEFHSNFIHPINTFLQFNKFKNIDTKYYNINDHFNYFVKNINQDKQKHMMGIHIMLDFDEVDFNILENTNYILDMMDNIATKENFIVLNKTMHKFEPQGFTCIFLLSTSHFSIHTYPEYNKCSIDLYSCDTTVNYNNVIKNLKEKLKSENFRLHQVLREI